MVVPPVELPTKPPTSTPRPDILIAPVDFDEVILLPVFERPISPPTAWDESPVAIALEE